MIRVGIIGAGAIAQHHLRVLSALPVVEIVALANRNAERREATAVTFRIPKTYEHHSLMCATEKLDALYIFTSANTIFTLTKECISYGLPLFIEKPAGLTAAETRQLAAEAKKAGVPIMVGYNRRFYSIFENATKAIAAKGPLLGVSVNAPESIDLVRAKGKFPPALIDKWLILNGTHGLDLLRFLGGDMREVDVQSREFSEARGDNFGALVRFENSALGHYQAHWNSPGRWTVDLYGVGIRAHIEPLEEGWILSHDGSRNPIPIDPVDLEYKPGFYRQHEFFAHCVETHAPITRPACSIEDAVVTMELAELLEKVTHPVGKSLAGSTIKRFRKSLSNFLSSLFEKIRV